MKSELVTSPNQTLIASKQHADGYIELGYSSVAKPQYAYCVAVKTNDAKDPKCHYHYFDNEGSARSFYDYYS